MQWNELEKKKINTFWGHPNGYSFFKKQGCTVRYVRITATVNLFDFFYQP